MIKDFLLIRAASNVPPAQVQHYLQFKHAPLALSVPIVAREMKRYTMNHVNEEATPQCCLFQTVAGLASVVEHMFGGWEGMERIEADPHYCSLIRPDEAYMIGHLMAGAPQFIAIDEERSVLESGNPSCTRMFDLLRRPASISRAAFLEALHEDAEWAMNSTPYRSAVAKRVHSIAGDGFGEKSEATSYGTGSENFDAIVEVWIADIPHLEELIVEQRERRAEFCDSERSFTAMTREHRIVN